MVTGFDHHDPDVEALMYRRSLAQAAQPGVRARSPIFVLPTDDTGTAGWNDNPGDWADHQGGRTPADALAPLIQAMTAVAEKFTEAMRGFAAACVSANGSLLKMAEQWERDRVAQEQEQRRVRDELDHLYAAFTPPPLVKLDHHLPHLPLPADRCPRHGPIRGGTCWRCRR